MKFHELKGKLSRPNKRVGRGLGSGTGKTAGRGTKGQKARTGHHMVPVAFEGGQMPLHMRLPKSRGFKRPINQKRATITLGMLEKKFSADSIVDNASLLKVGLIRQADAIVRIVSSGTLTKKLTVRLPLSKSAAELVKKVGGAVEIVERPTAKQPNLAKNGSKKAAKADVKTETNKE